jgi:hypothetical protein
LRGAGEIRHSKSEHALWRLCLLSRGQLSPAKSLLFASKIHPEMSDENPRATSDPEVEASPPLVINKQADLSDWLSKKSNEGQIVQTRLSASDRVIARVTDGIYRQPGSALRELISNAWDADANNVTILTDAPRFSKIYVRDDGAGMSHATLARLLHSIGGSAKRHEEGQQLGITADDDTDRTPGGRPLIGKIGIGLFSVSQLARRFRIVTKQKNTDYRLVAEVRLRAYSEDDSDDAHREGDDTFITGDVYITREPADELDAHGTDIILEDVKPRVRDLLRSADRWELLKVKQEAIAKGDTDTAVNIKVDTPRYHTGWIENLARSGDMAAVLTEPPHLPWSETDPTDMRMQRLVEAVEAEFTRLERPDLVSTLDAYLEMMWTLGLSAPVGYVDKHPFDLTSADQVRLFWLSNDMRGQAQEIKLGPGLSVRQAVQAAGHPVLEDGIDAAAGAFKVVIDGVELKRPIRFKFIKTERRGLDHSMLFVGRWEPNLRRISPSQRGGDLALEGYLFWNGRIVPKENNGILIRIRGASGALFDPTFFKYQVSEQTRLRQITSELFIRQGLDAALNIDRESFNFSHPHVQLVASWVHRAVRQLTNKHKEVSKRIRTERREEDAFAYQDALLRHSEQVWVSQRGDDPVPDVLIAANHESAQRAREEGYLAVVQPRLRLLAAPSTETEQQKQRDSKTEALVRVLAAYGVLAEKSYDEQQALVEAILEIFF